MQISSLSSLLSANSVQSLTSTRASGQTQDVSGAGSTDPRPEISKLGSYLKQLNELQSSDPEKYKQVTAEIAQKLEDAAKTASDSGDTRQSEFLTKLADKFKTASENGTQIHLRGGHGHHGGGGAQGVQGPPPDADGDNDGSSSSSSVTSNLASKYAEFMQSLKQQSESDPRTTLTNILTDVLGK